MAILETELDRLVSLETGEIDRRIFSDPDIFELEMKLIFERAWLFLCHESQIKKAGDFVEAPMGRDNVLVVRQKDKSIKGLLNTCAHRGNAVCRAEEGNTKNFMCTYHGWTYDLAGRLIGVPGLEQFYKGDLDRESLGLREVAQLGSYKGFVFATLDPTAPPLLDYLGTTGRLGIDLIAAQGDMEVVPGVRKFVIPCNWKFAVDNLFDWYHPQITHMSAFTPGVFPVPTMPEGAATSQIDPSGATRPDGTALLFPEQGGNPDSIVVIGEYGHAIAGPTSDGAPSVFPQTWRERPEAQAALGPVGVRVGGHPNIFPTSWIAVSTELSLRVPRSPTETELWWFTFVDRSAPPELQQLQIMMANHVFGPSGMLEQEDGENWAQSTAQTMGGASRRIPQVLKMNLGRGKVIKEHDLARIEGKTTEHGQMWTYHSWAQWMRGSDWDTLRDATNP
ncbi:MAG: hypothetical protein QOC92_283, partial [Acidimicrobiaceae bacterium]